MAQSNKNDLEKLMDKNSTRTIVLSYAMTIVFGIAAAFACMAWREMLEQVALKIILGSEMHNMAQYGGLRRVTQIVAITTMVTGWMISFMVVWHKIEHGETLRDRVIICVKWVAIAVAAYFLFSVIQYIVVGYWPTLRGSV